MTGSQDSEVGAASPTFTDYDSAQLDLLVGSIKTLEQLFLTEFDIQLYLTWGTLLGAIRHQDFISHDIDVDVAYLSTKSLDYEILEEHEYIVAVLKEQGFNVFRNSKGQIHVRVLSESESGEGAAFNLDLWTTWTRNGRYYHYPDIKGELTAESVLPLIRQKFHGEEFLVPTGFDSVLTCFYGENWRQPDKNYAWYPRYNADDDFEFLRSSAVSRPTPLPEFPCQAASLQIREEQEHYFVSGPSLAEEQRLNPTAIVILELCTGENSVPEIIRLVQEAYELPTAPEVAVLEFLSNAQQSGLLKSREPD